MNKKAMPTTIIRMPSVTLAAFNGWPNIPIRSIAPTG